MGVIPLAIAEDQHGHQDRGKGQLHIGDAHDDRLGPAADIARDQPKRDAQDHGKGHRGKAHKKRDAQTEEDGREHIAALIVGAEKESSLR